MKSLSGTQKLLLLGAGIATVGAIGLIYAYLPKGESTLALSYDDTLGKVAINGIEYAPLSEVAFPIGRALTLTATPNANMYFTGWLIDGASQSMSEEISFTPTQPQHLISALFSTVPPNGTHIPAILYAVNSPVSISQRVSCGVVQGYYDWTLVIKYRLADWTTEGISGETIIFRVEDSAGNGIGNLPIEVWTNDMPDNNDNSMAGGANLFLNNLVHNSVNPLTVYTLANGEAYIAIKYLPVDFNRFIHQHYHICSNIGFCECAKWDGYVYPGWAGARSIKYDCPAGGPDAPANHLVLPQVNTVYAKLKDTVLLTQAIAQCALEIKIT